MTWGAYVAISAARSTSLLSQGLQMFHVMTRFGTTSLTASTGSDLVKGVPLGALEPRSTMQATITTPASDRMPRPSTLASSLWIHMASDISVHELMGRRCRHHLPGPRAAVQE
ncbi:hypothetical protein GCM10010294_54930 [Streptomyces griseoloalbus]|nr:hypothetical protein GCM10010294_54930 [Streptomyces griseoloalbus]